MPGKSSAPKRELPVKRFRSQEAWRKWLQTNHERSQGLWIEFAKKASGQALVNYKQALEVALCYGWIDGQTTAVDEIWYRQRFTPRRPRSAGGRRSTAHRSSGFTPKVVWLRRAFGRWRRPSATGGGRRRILHRETSRYRRTWKRRWRRMPAPAGRSSSWTGRTDSPSCIGCTMRRSLRPANGGSETLSGCGGEASPRSVPSNRSPPTQSLHSLQILLEISDRHIQRRPTPGISRLKESHHVGHPAVLDRAPRGIVVPGYQTVRMVGLELEARATHPIQLALDRHDLAGCVTPGPETRYHRSTRTIYQPHLLP